MRLCVEQTGSVERIEAELADRSGINQTAICRCRNTRCCKNARLYSANLNSLRERSDAQ